MKATENTWELTKCLKQCTASPWAGEVAQLDLVWSQPCPWYQTTVRSEGLLQNITKAHTMMTHATSKKSNLESPQSTWYQHATLAAKFWLTAKTVSCTRAECVYTPGSAHVSEWAAFETRFNIHRKSVFCCCRHSIPDIFLTPGAVELLSFSQQTSPQRHESLLSA